MMQTIAEEEIQRALSKEKRVRHSKSPSASDAEEKPPPCTVSGVPPSASAELGERYATPAAGWYVYRTPLGAYCCPFRVTVTVAGPAAIRGVKHSSCDSSTYRAGVVEVTLL